MQKQRAEYYSHYRTRAITLIEICIIIASHTVIDLLYNLCDSAWEKCQFHPFFQSGVIPNVVKSSFCATKCATYFLVMKAKCCGVILLVFTYSCQPLKAKIREIFD